MAVSNSLRQGSFALGNRGKPTTGGRSAAQKTGLQCDPRTRADLPLMTQSTLSTFAPLMEEAVDEAKQSIDRALDNRHPEKGN